MRSWKDWEEVHQPFELQYHIEEGIGWCSDELQFTTFWNRIFGFIGGPRGNCLDVGCGPRPPFGQESTAIDPLAGQYKRLVPHWWRRVEGYSTAAEDLIPDFEGKFDAVLCWNCLDHTIGWRKILANLAAYGSKGAVFGIATDFDPPHVGHPGFAREEFFTVVDKHFEISKQIENFQERDVAMVLCAR